MRNRVMLVLGALLLCLSAPSMLLALNVPQRMNYQAVLTSGAEPVTSAVNVVFRIYDAESGGTVLWEESRSVTPDGAGRINVQLGTTTPLDESVFNGADRWLALEVESDGEITPRSALASAGYSFKVSTVDGAKGGELTGDVVIKSAAAAENSMSYSLADATLTLQSLSGHRVVLGPADQVVLRALDDLDNEQLAATIDPVAGAVLAIRDPGGNYSQHMSTASSYFGDNLAKGSAAIVERTRISSAGLFNFNDLGEITHETATLDNAGFSEYTNRNAFAKDAFLQSWVTRVGAETDLSGTTLFGLQMGTKTLSSKAVDNPSMSLRLNVLTAEPEIALLNSSAGTIASMSSTDARWSASGSGATSVTLLSASVDDATGELNSQVGLFDAQSTKDAMAQAVPYSIRLTDAGPVIEMTNQSLSATKSAATRKMEIKFVGSEPQMLYTDLSTGQPMARFAAGEMTLYDPATGNVTVSADNTGSVMVMDPNTQAPNLQIDGAGNMFGRGQVAMGQNFDLTKGVMQTPGTWSTVFGFNNEADGDSSTISGGYFNKARSRIATISGGAANKAGTDHGDTISTAEVVGGGYGNEAVSRGATIAGGIANAVLGEYSTLGGGYYDTVYSYASFVGGGLGNIAGVPGTEARHQTIGGGTNNHVTGWYSTVAGGNGNVADGGSAIGGGGGNYASGTSVVAGGIDNRADGPRCFVGGGANNHATSTNGYAAVGGGASDTTLADYSFIGGGYHNIISATGGSGVISGGSNNAILYGACVIAGGQLNSASQYGAIGGGSQNVAVGSMSVVGGGVYNKARGAYSTVSGGGGNNDLDSNTAHGAFAVVPGGKQNYANGDYSLASGQRAKALHNGEYVWADSRDHNFPSANDEGGGNVNWLPLGGQPTGNQFLVRATGGVGFISGVDGTSGDVTSGVALPSGSGAWSAMSDRNSKENIAPVDLDDILHKIDQLQVSTWNYRTQSDEVRHMGPMAQDLYALFGLGESDRHISTIDADGVALAAIKALNEKTKRIDELEARVAELQRLLEQVLAAER